MKKFKIGLAIIFSIFVSSCSVLPLKTDIDGGKFRFENHYFGNNKLDVRVHLMCYRKKASGFTIRRQILAGHHIMWINATISTLSMEDKRDGQAIIEMDFDAGKDYRLNQKIDGENIKVWIEESNNSDIKSEVITVLLENRRVRFHEERVRTEKCQSGSI